MDKSARIRAFLELSNKNSSLTVKSTTELFKKLLQNVKHEYKNFHNNREPKINNFEFNEPSESHYLQDQNFISSFTKFKENQELPFSITSELLSTNPTSCQISFPSSHVLRTSYFVSSSTSRETFFQIQRQHKIWWMKFGSSPGKYSISDQKIENNFKFVTIQSNLEDPALDIEQLKLFSLKDTVKDKDLLAKYFCKIPNRKKEVIPDVIEASVDLQIASFALLKDAVESSEYHTALHRRSSPYQLAVITNGSATNDLKDLARYIELLVTASEPRIDVLNHSKIKIAGEDDLEKQFAAFDNIGIPYTIVLDDEALESGLFKLRSRNTTLSETIHLSDVNKYLIKIFNSA